MPTEESSRAGGASAEVAGSVTLWDLEKLASKLCQSIESLPASDEQTRVSLEASNLRMKIYETAQVFHPKDCFPLVLYFYTWGARALAVEQVREAAPGLSTRSY